MAKTRTISLTHNLFHDNSVTVIYVSVFRKTHHIGNYTNCGNITEATEHIVASLSDKNHSAPVLHFLHRGVKKKKNNCKFILRSAILKPSNWHGSNYLTICFVIHYAFWKWLSSKVLQWTFPWEAFSGAEGRLPSIKAHSSQIYYYCRAQWAKAFTQIS